MGRSDVDNRDRETYEGTGDDALVAEAQPWPDPAHLRGLLADIVGPDLVVGVDDDTDLVDGLRLDSIQVIAFLLHVEDVLDVELDFDTLDLDHVRSLRRFGAFVRACGAPAA